MPKRLKMNRSGGSAHLPLDRYTPQIVEEMIDGIPADG